MLNNKKMMLTVIISIIIIAAGYRLFLHDFVFHDDHDDLIRSSRFLMDTYFEVRTPSGSEDEVEQVFVEMERIDEISDRYNPESYVAKINENAGAAPVEVNDDIIIMLDRAIYYSELTGGLFDVTVGPLIDLWDIGSENERIPEREEIEDVLTLVDYEAVEIDKEESTVYLSREGMSLDLGAVAKGYAVDRAFEIFKNAEIEQAIIQAGGSVRVMGMHPEGREWGVGIKNPRNQTNFARLPVKDRVVDTSGDYERYFIENGERYHHIFNPRTGYPASEVVSATVITDNALDGDILSTSLFLMGDDGLRIIEELGTEGLIVYENLDYSLTPGFSEKASVSGNEAGSEISVEN